jgi:hypothetical protein
LRGLRGAVLATTAGFFAAGVRLGFGSAGATATAGVGSTGFSGS